MKREDIYLSFGLLFCIILFIVILNLLLGWSKFTMIGLLVFIILVALVSFVLTIETSYELGF